MGIARHTLLRKLRELWKTNSRTTWDQLHNKWLITIEAISSILYSRPQGSAETHNLLISLPQCTRHCNLLCIMINGFKTIILERETKISCTDWKRSTSLWKQKITTPTILLTLLILSGYKLRSCQSSKTRLLKLMSWTKYTISCLIGLFLTIIMTLALYF